MLGKFINHKEDSLTAAIFTHLLHLPVEVFWVILRNSCYGDLLPKTVGEPTEIVGWPNWNAENTRNTRRVVPDLFIRFPEFDLIIEAKRWDAGMQTRGQWEDQITAYTNEFGDEDRLLKFIALGGIHGQKPEEIVIETGVGTEARRVECPIVMCQWARILDQCKRMRQECGRLEYGGSQNTANIRVIDDLIDLFSWHGYSTGRWFKDFEFGKHRLTSMLGGHHQILQSSRYGASTA